VVWENFSIALFGDCIHARLRSHLARQKGRLYEPVRANAVIVLQIA